MAVVGREFRFPLDIELLDQSSLNNKEHSALFHYLRNISFNLQFSISVLQILIDERRSAHSERWNKNREAYKFNKGDVTKAHLQVQSKLDNGDVDKLSYRARRSFRIIEDLGSDSYHVK